MRMQTYRNNAAAMVLAAAIAVVFLPAVLFPHYLADDLWIFRPQSEGFPDLWFIAVNQGRPVFAVLIQFSKSIHGLVGVYAVSIIRAFAILFLIAFGVAAYRIALDYKFRTCNAFLLALILSTLPGSQMYVVGGPWLSLGWATSAWCARWILNPGVDLDFSRRSFWIYAVLFINVVLSLFLYQAVPFVFFSLMVLPVLFSRLSIKSITLTPSIVFILGIFVYVLIWLYITKTIDAGQDRRYSIQNFNVSFYEQYTLLHLRAELFINKRLPMVLSLWDVREGALLSQWFVSLIVVSGFLCDIARQRGLQLKLGAALRWGAAILLFILSDFAALAAKPGTLVFSYMTSGAPMVALAIIVVYAMQCIKDIIFPKLTSDRVHRGTAFIAGLLAIVFSSYTVTAFYVLPAWIEHSLVRASLRNQLERVGKITNVVAYTRATRTISNGARGEFSWSNLSYRFYLHWLIRMCLDQLKQDSDLKIDVNSSDGKVYTYPKFKLEPTDDGRVIVDLRPVSLDRNAPLEQPFFEMNRDRLPVGSGDRPAHAPDVVSRWNRQPNGETTVAFQVRRSSFHYEGQGAVGEKGLNDGDIAVPAADAGGVNIGTEVVMQVPENVLVNRVRLVRDSKWGSDYNLSMKVQVSDDMESWLDVGQMEIRGAISSLAEAELKYDKPHKFIRLAYFSGLPGENIWISEISLFQKTPR